MSTSTAEIQGPIYIGQVWALGSIGYNDILTISGYDSSGSTTMELMITRTRGVVVGRTDVDDHTDDAMVFCVDTSSVFEVDSGHSGRCPIGETNVILANWHTITNSSLPNLDDWTPSTLLQDMNYLCKYNVGCTPTKVQQGRFG